MFSSNSEHRPIGIVEINDPSDKNFQVLCALCRAGLTDAAIGEEFGVSRQRIHQVRHEIINRYGEDLVKPRVKWRKPFGRKSTDLNLTRSVFTIAEVAELLQSDSWIIAELCNEEIIPSHKIDAGHGKRNFLITCSGQMLSTFMPIIKERRERVVAHSNWTKGEYVQMLRTNIEKFNELRPSGPVDLQWIVIHGAKLSGANLQDVDLSNAHLRGARLDNVNAAGVKMHGTNLSETYCKQVDFSLADLVGLRAYNSRWSESILCDANMSYATFKNSAMLNIDMSRSVLIGANLCRTDLRGANFLETKFGNTDLKEANLWNAKNLPTEIANQYCELMRRSWQG